MTLGEFEDRIKNLREGDDKDDRLTDGSTLRVTVPDGTQLDVVGVSVRDAAAKEKGEGYVALHLDQPMGA